MIKLNDQKKLAEDYIYFRKCRNFLLLSIIFVGVYLILLFFLLLFTPLKINWLFMFFMMMYLSLMPVREAQTAEAKKIWDPKSQTIKEKS